VIALSLTKLVNPGDRILRYTREEEGRKFLGDSLEELQQKFASTVKVLPQKIIGLIWHVITPGVDESANMFIVAQHTLVNGINRTSMNDDAPLVKVYERLEKVFEWT
jgi:hypothetical protein